MLIGEDKICEIVSENKSLNWNNMYTCGCYFNEAIQSFDDFCRRCLCHGLKAVSYLLYNLFLEKTKYN